MMRYVLALALLSGCAPPCYDYIVLLAPKAAASTSCDPRVHTMEVHDAPDGVVVRCACKAPPAVTR